MGSRRMTRILAPFAAVALVFSIASAPALAADTGSAEPAPPPQNPGAIQPRTSAAINAEPTPTCSRPTNGNQICFHPGNGSRTSSKRPAVLAVNPYPDICKSSADNGGEVMADSRLQACKIYQGAYLLTTRVVGGVPRETGRLYIDLWDWTYSSYDLPNWTHQGGVVGVATGSYGPPLQSTVSGTFGVSGQCAVNGVPSFLPQPMQPLGTIRSGDGSARTTATTLGAVGFCSTAWNLTFAIPGLNPVSVSSGDMSEIRCDNAVGGYLQNPVRPGCVVPWYSASVVYSQSRYPSLASHVSRAQGSNLPGKDYWNPMYRSTDPQDESVNRTLACSGAPSVPDFSCDEYPLATTYNGLRYGGTRRTFDGCQINAPTNVTDPEGASACMIPASENSAQGGLMSGFYYNHRVLDQDPFLVAVGS
ncbi:hypothetical protein DMB66_47460 [Actinoplanes sp. ATCC 53533]|nr:hypothetical protein DMB66_47460 [Actinoplanes sp. ATCC 53533]